LLSAANADELAPNSDVAIIAVAINFLVFDIFFSFIANRAAR
jgi:hypothetical protein